MASLSSDALPSGADMGSQGVTIVATATIVPTEVATENCRWAGTTTPSNKELKLTKPAFGASQLNSVLAAYLKCGGTNGE